MTLQWSFDYPKYVKDMQYLAYLEKYGVRNPDDPRHQYDYRAAFEAKYKPVKWESLPEEDKEEDIRQAMEGRRTGRAMSKEDAEKLYKDKYMWSDLYKQRGHRIPAR